MEINNKRVCGEGKTIKHSWTREIPNGTKWMVTRPALITVEMSFRSSPSINNN
jgi:hypothetical protein